MGLSWFAVGWNIERFNNEIIGAHCRQIRSFTRIYVIRTFIRRPFWLLLVWAPYWILNILGEEFIWRGVMLPRQEIAFGKHTWIIHGFGWCLFHIAFGWQLLLMLVPLMFIQSYILQRTKNTWVRVMMDGGLNGPSFIAICFGWI